MATIKTMARPEVVSAGLDVVRVGRGEFLPPALALALAAAGAGPDKSDPVAGRSRNE